MVFWTAAFRIAVVVLAITFPAVFQPAGFFFFPVSATSLQNTRRGVGLLPGSFCNGRKAWLEHL
jgi:hypothetical protein